MNTTRKILAAAVLAGFASQVSATDFYIDYGVDNTAGPGTSQTGDFERMTIAYDSTTEITDNGDGFFGAGDTVVGTGGVKNAPQLGIGSSSDGDNNVTGFIPGDSYNNDYGLGLNGSWYLTFGWDNLMGTVNASGGIDYTSGTIDLFLNVGGTAYNVLDLEVTSGGNNDIGQSLNLFGELSIGADGETILGGGVRLADMFHLASTGQSFEDYLASGVDAMITFEANQNTEPYYINGEQVSSGAELAAALVNFYDCAIVDGEIDREDCDATGLLAGEHDGSVTFQVPVPAPLLLIGVGLLGLSRLRRKV